MDTVKLKSKRGPTCFRRRVITHDECGNKKFEMRLFEFNFDNDFRCEVPVYVWEELEGLPFDRNFNLLYKDVFQTI